jgi:hypothetical protein
MSPKIEALLEALVKEIKEQNLILREISDYIGGLEMPDYSTDISEMRENLDNIEAKLGTIARALSNR